MNRKSTNINLPISFMQAGPVQAATRTTTARVTSSVPTSTFHCLKTSARISARSSVWSAHSAEAIVRSAHGGSDARRGSWQITNHAQKKSMPHSLSIIYNDLKFSNLLDVSIDTKQGKQKFLGLPVTIIFENFGVKCACPSDLKPFEENFTWPKWLRSWVSSKAI